MRRWGDGCFRIVRTFFRLVALSSCRLVVFPRVALPRVSASPRLRVAIRVSMLERLAVLGRGDFAPQFKRRIEHRPLQP